MRIIGNAGLLLLLMPLMNVLVAIFYIFSRFDSGSGNPFIMFFLFLLSFFSSYVGVGEALAILFLFSFLGVICNICGIIFSIIFFRWITQVFVIAVVFTANMFLSLLFLPSSPLDAFGIGYGMMLVVNVNAVLLSLGIVMLDRIYMKRYFKTMLTIDNDVMLAKINKMKVSNVTFYLNEYKRKEPLLYNSIVAKFEKAGIEHPFEIKGIIQ